MPTINLPKKAKKSNHHNQTDMRKLRQSAYNTTAWRKLRETYLKQNPLCEECLNLGRVTAASSVHHIKSPFLNGSVNQALFLDFDNLESICHDCHAELHNKEQGYITPKEILRQLEELMDNNISDEYFEESK